MNINKKIIETTIKNQLNGDILSFENELNKLDKISGTKYPIVDAHIHIVDFNGKTTGLKNLIQYMDSSNIKSGVIFGMPVVKIWQENERQRPDYYLDDDNPCYYNSQTDVMVAREYLSLSQKDRKRFFPLLCGFNPNDINCVEHIINTFQTFPGVFYGIGEVFYRHDDLTHMTYGEAPRMNTLATRKLFEFVTKYDLPICIHNNITAPGVSDYPKFLYEMEEIIREFPKARIILAHCGASRRLRAPYYTKMISRLFSEYKSFYVDLSWVIFDEIISVSETSMNDWVELTEEFSDRIMIGSDVLGDAFEEIGVINSRFNIFLDKLTPETRQKVCIKNAIKIYSKSKNRVEKGKILKYPKLSQLKNNISIN
ncbi:MAG: amidohydrolase family protein [Candidatus Gracilibacteria bacterium]|nr:amidohydrolase family protein [Candidatus Gracilibacteria bacterium]